MIRNASVLVPLLAVICFSSPLARGQTIESAHSVDIPSPSVIEDVIDSVTDGVVVEPAAEAVVKPINDAVAEAIDGPIIEPTIEPEADPPAIIPSWDAWTKPERLTDSLRVVAVMAALSLAPALLLMTTCYVRIVVVLSLLRQALGSQQLPPNQVTTTLALFLTLLIMFPVWRQVHEEAIKPYTDPEISMTAEEAWAAGIAPVREFMSQQIDRQGNRADVLMFLDYVESTNPSLNPPPEYYSDVPLQALLPAFLLSELKVAFLIGFQVYLPFVIIDLVVSSVTMSMGMVMVPPTTISLPMKLILFVLADGWHLVVDMLLKSFHYG
jgi:flagellar biosynthetic protein FliP